MRRKGREYGTHGNNETHGTRILIPENLCVQKIRVFRYFRLFRILSSANITVDLRKFMQTIQVVIA